MPVLTKGTKMKETFVGTGLPDGPQITETEQTDRQGCWSLQGDTRGEWYLFRKKSTAN